MNVHITLSFQHLKEKHVTLQEQAWQDDLLCGLCAQSCDSCLVSFTLKNWETVFKKIGTQQRPINLDKPLLWPLTMLPISW